MADEQAIVPSENMGTEDFAKWAGFTFTEEPEEDAAPEPETEDAEQPDATDAEPETDAETDAEPDAEPEVEPEPVPDLPFAATADDEPVDAALLAKMQVTIKADGKEQTLPLADVVRRAQSEPAAQRKAQQAMHQIRDYEQKLKSFEDEVSEVRAVALRMARDPDYYAQVANEVQGYDAPEARAERAERQLAADRKAQQDARRQAEESASLQEFATTAIAPTLNAVVEQNPLVSQEEILGKFLVDTASITKNGVIPREYHQSVAEYLRTDLAQWVAERQQKLASIDAKAKAEALKTQRERQKMKNQTASKATPVGQPGAMRGEQPAKAPRTYREAQDNALAALVGGLQ
jgi:hypothetical protein